MNQTDQAIFPYKSSLIFSTRYFFRRTDLDGKIIWSSIPTYGPGAGQVGTDIAQLLYNDRIYGVCNGAYDSWGYSISAETGDVLWTAAARERDNSSTTTSINGVMTDGIGLYKVSDINGLIGLDLLSGKQILNSGLSRHIHSPVDFNVSGGVAVEGNRVYFLSVDSIYCMQRMDK